MLNYYLKIAKRGFTNLRYLISKFSGRCKQSRTFPWCWYTLWGLFLFVSLVKELKGAAKGLPDSSYIIIMVIIVSIIRSVRPRLIKRWHYFQEKPSAPYIMLFMILLLCCTFLLIVKLEPVAKQLANVAYFLLVTGVGIEFYQLMKQRKCESTDDNVNYAGKNKNL